MSHADPFFLPRKLSPLPSIVATHRKSRYVFKYLTPHKILILILIHAYCNSSVPGKHQGVVLTFLLENIEVNG